MDYQEVKVDDVNVLVRKPGVKDYRDAQLVYNKAFRKALEGGAILKQKLNDFIIEQGLWDDKKEAKYKGLLNKIRDIETVLSGGGISLSKAKEAAIDLRRTRNELQELISDRNSYESNTAEGQADNEKFNYLVMCCSVKGDKTTRIWATMEEYDNDATKPWAIECATKLAGMLYGLDPNYESSLPENKFLLDFKFADKNFDLINKEGHLVDVEGRLIDKDGYYVKYVNGVQVKVNRDGKELNEDGKIKVEFKPFLDDEGNPVVVDTTPTVETSSTESV
jgi:hypothetical protein